jgi:GT2 family glycosyltransferase
MTQKLVLPRAERPAVSVLMALYGRWDWARRALVALRDRTPAVYDVTVVDNASPDGAGDLLEREVEGVTVIRNDHNVGFGRAIVQAATSAPGETLCILNSDALVQEGWLEPMLARLEDPTAGAVVPMYLDEAGRVHEAGSAVGSDGFTLAWGRELDPADPAVRFPRAVDYGSAACLIVRSDAFRAVGGFAQDYGVGYFEDVDLSFELAKRGLRTVYEPRARVVHGESASSSRERAAEHMRRNRGVFLARQAERLAGRPKLEQIDVYPHRPVHARDWIAPLRVLVLGERVPFAGRAAAAIAEGAASIDGVRVTVSAGRVERHEMERLLAIGIEMVPSEGAGWLSARPAHPTVVVVEGPDVAARYASALLDTQPHAALVYDVEGAGSQGVGSRSTEMAMLARADVVLAPTEGHAVFVRELRTEVPVIVVPEDPVGAAAAAADALAHVGIVIDARASA